MKTEIKTAIKAMAKKSAASTTGDDALKYTQAVANLALALARIMEGELRLKDCGARTHPHL